MTKTFRLASLYKILLIVPIGLILIFPTSASAIYLHVNLQGEVEVFDDRVLGEEIEQEDEEIEHALKEVEVEVTGEAGVPVKTPKPEILRKIAPHQTKSQEIRLRPTTKNETIIQIREQQKRGELINTPADREKAELKEEFKADRVRLEFNDNKSLLRETQRQKASEFKTAEKESMELEAEDRREFLEQRMRETEVELEEKRYEVDTEEPYQRMKIEDTVHGDERQIRLESPDGSASRLINGELILETDTSVVRVATSESAGTSLQTFPSEIIESIQNTFVIPETSRTDIELEVKEDGSLRHRIRDVENEERVFGVFRMKVRGDALIDDATGEIEFESNEPNLVKRFLRVFRR